MKKSELWKKLVEEVGEEEIEAAARVTVAEAEAELAAAGFDVAAERAKAGAFLDQLARGTLDDAPHATPADAPRTTAVAIAGQKARRSVQPERRPGPPPMVVLLGTAVVAAAAGAALYAATHQTPEPVAPRPTPTTSPTVVPSTPPPDLAAAAALRRVATADCDAKHWDECLAHLEQARDVDPAGDDAPAVKKLRDRAIAGIFEKRKAP